MNKYRFDGDLCYIEISTKKYGKFEVKIDREDYPRIKMFIWHVCGLPRNTYYVRANLIDNATISLHRLIMSFPDKSIIDHRDRNTLNNTKSNLRECDTARNVLNRLSARKFKGVRKRGKKFESHVTIDSKYVHIGTYHNETDAALAYNNYCLKIRDTDFFIPNKLTT